MMDGSRKRKAMESAVTVIIGPSRHSPEKMSEGRPDRKTSPDPVDGHTHDIPSWAIDDDGNGSTAPAETEAGTHVHAIMDDRIVDSIHGDYVSKHKEIIPTGGPDRFAGKPKENAEAYE